MLSIGWFSTGRGEGSRGLLQFVQERILKGNLNAQIQFVFSNRGPGEAAGSDQFFDLARSYDLPLVTLSSAEFRRQRGGSFARHREEFDQQASSLLSGRQPDICVLAGYMLILGGAMCRQYPFLNLHPALPDGPIGTWQEVIWQLIETTATHTGAMIHLATEAVDRGPVVSYCTVPIVGEEFKPHWKDLDERDVSQIKTSQGEDFKLFQLIRQAEYQREPYLLFETLRTVADGKVLPKENRLLNNLGKPLSANGLCLDEEINRAMIEDGLG
ncbi:MAG: formyltransferase family protein [Chloroflexi bacterium]|nr:formyltransferase family protein [Chloroflexota bacterium]MDA1218702.1 formyltransferase family protein [Chloroflexota bacterium]PKB57788.1 MAG: hypothetical protein BZY73_01485 [SAR202 cluster bacterium Casp-Chloro-G3]